MLCFALAILASPFKSKLRLEAENAVLRHQLNVLGRKLRGRVQLTNHDRWFFVQLYRWFPSILTALTIVRPATLVRWHRAGFRCYWRWKSRRRGGRPQIEADLRTLDAAVDQLGRLVLFYRSAARGREQQGEGERGRGAAGSRMSGHGAPSANVGPDRKVIP